MYSYIVIGAGPAGLAFASSINDSNVLVIDLGKPLSKRDRFNSEECVQGAGGAGLFSDGKFRQPYIDGLSTIAGWMGYADTISFLNELSPTMVRQMRSIFHREVENIMKELEELRLRS